MKPIIILPRGAMKPDDIQRLNDNDLCVVEADDPASVRFVDPIPAAASRTAVEDAAIRLSRKLLAKGFWTDEGTRKTVAATYVDLLVRGTPLDAEPSQQEVEKREYDGARLDEVRRLAREDARAARAEAKAKAAADAAAKARAKEPKA